MNQYYVYILTNHTNSVLYTGITNNIERRHYEHKKAIHENSFTKRYKLYKLVWYEVFFCPEEAIACEKRIKGWTREKKLRLICQLNPTFKNLLR